MPRDDTVIYHLSRTFIYARILNILKAQTNSFYITKKSAKALPKQRRKEARKKKKKSNSNTTTKNVSLDASSVRSPRRERVSGPKRGAVFGTEKLESKCDYVGIRFRARV